MNQIKLNCVSTTSMSTSQTRAHTFATSVLSQQERKVLVIRSCATYRNTRMYMQVLSNYLMWNSFANSKSKKLQEQLWKQLLSQSKSVLRSSNHSSLSRQYRQRDRLPVHQNASNKLSIKPTKSLQWRRYVLKNSIRSQWAWKSQVCRDSMRNVNFFHAFKLRKLTKLWWLAMKLKTHKHPHLCTTTDWRQSWTSFIHQSVQNRSSKAFRTSLPLGKMLRRKKSKELSSVENKKLNLNVLKLSRNTSKLKQKQKQPKNKQKQSVLPPNNKK